MSKLHKSIFMVWIFVLLMTSCQSQSTDPLITSDTLQEVATPDENLSFMTDTTLEILYTNDRCWGVRYENDDNAMINYVSLSNLCKEKLGFPIKFKLVSSAPAGKSSDIALHIQSGLSGDLIFPVNTFTTQDKSDFHWGQEYIRQGLYMDLSPYLERFCPEAILNFERYPQIKDNLIIDGKIYAIYAGVPLMKTAFLKVKNDLLRETGVDINSINSVDALYEFMDGLYHGNEPDSSFSKIFVAIDTLLDYAVTSSGYYRFFGYPDIVFDINDESCTPRLIEDTSVIDTFYELFYKFIKNGYFTVESGESNFSDDTDESGQDITLSFWNPDTTKYLVGNTIDEKNNVFQKYSFALMNDFTPVAHLFNTFIHIMVPVTSTQPEKALIFMQWLMTDKDAADILTFGSQLLNMNHYRFAEDGQTIIPEKRNTIYAFYNLVGNFSEKPFLYGKHDIIHEYKERSYQVIYPHLIKKIDSDNELHAKFADTVNTASIRAQSDKRRSYLEKALGEIIQNPYTDRNINRIKNGIADAVNAEEFKEMITEAIYKVFD
jgi:hypothetical protein